MAIADKYFFPIERFNKIFFNNLETFQKKKEKGWTWSQKVSLKNIQKYI